MVKDFLSNFSWHSSLGLEGAVEVRKVVSRLPNTKVARSMFLTAGNSLLIHKTNKCLWKVSRDGNSIEPVFASDVLSEEDVREAMEGGE